MFALRSFLGFLVKSIVRGGTELSVSLLGGPFKMSIIFDCASVGFPIKKEIWINFYFFFDEVMERLGISI